MVGKNLCHGHILDWALRFRSFLPWLCIRRLFVRCFHLHGPRKPDQYALDGLEAHLSSGSVPEDAEIPAGDGINEAQPIVQVCFKEDRTGHETKLPDSRRKFPGRHCSCEEALLPIKTHCRSSNDAAIPLVDSSVINALQSMNTVLNYHCVYV